MDRVCVMEVSNCKHKITGSLDCATDHRTSSAEQEHRDKLQVGK